MRKPSLAMLIFIPLLADCGEDSSIDGGNGDPTPTPRFVVSGEVAGLPTGESLVLTLNRAEELPVSENGDFAFTTQLASGSEYRVEATQVSSQTQCVLANESGTVADADVANVQVICEPSYQVNVETTGLGADSVSLRLNGGDELVIAIDGTEAFPTRLVEGEPYSVTIGRQPTGQRCELNNGVGTVGTMNVSVDVQCADVFTLGGTASGPASGLELEELESGQSLTLSGPGPFSFTEPLAENQSYDVRVATPPANARCSVTNGAGVMGGAAVEDLQVICETAYPVTVSLTGAFLQGIELSLNGAEVLIFNEDAEQTFTTTLDEAESFTVALVEVPDLPGAQCILSGEAGAASGPVEVTVQCGTSVQPTHDGTQWNAYIDAGDFSPCDPSAASTYADCVHAGPLRQLVYPQGSSCDGLTAEDSLGIFQWTCREIAPVVVFETTGLPDSHGLGDLIDFATGEWRSNPVVIRDGSEVVWTSLDQSWWINPISLNHAGPWDTSGTVYAYDDTASPVDIELEGDEIAVVVEPGATLTGVAPSEPLVLANGSYLWLEGAFSALGKETGVSFGAAGAFVIVRRFRLTDSSPTTATTAMLRVSSDFSRMEQVFISGTSGEFDLFGEGSLVSGLECEGIRTCLQVVNAPRCTLENFILVSPSHAGVRLDGSSDSAVLRHFFFDGDIPFGDVVFSANGAIAEGIVSRQGRLRIFGDGNIIRDSYFTDAGFSNIEGDGNLLQNVQFFNGSIFQIDGADNRLVRVLGAHYDAGFEHRGPGALNMALSMLQSGGSCLLSTGFNDTQMKQQSFFNLAVTHCGGDGLQMDLSGTADTDVEVTVRDAAVLNVAPALSVAGATGVEVTGMLKVTPTSGNVCASSDGGTDFGADCSGVAATLRSEVSAATSFFGEVATDGAVTNTSRGYDAVMVWTGFDSPYRGWGRSSAGPFPDNSSLGRCQSSATCQLWDWRLVSGDLGDPNGTPSDTADDVAALANVHAIPTGNDTAIHTFSTPSQSFCEGVLRADWDSVAGCRETFLLWAVELGGDGVGDDDGACESDEHCMYTPHLGAYQGSGELLELTTVGTEADTLTNITLFAFDQALEP